MDCHRVHNRVHSLMDLRLVVGNHLAKMVYVFMYTSVCPISCRLSLYVCVCVSARPSAHVLYMMLCVFCSMSECVCRCSSYLHVGTCLLSFQEMEGALEHSQQVIKLTLTTTSPTLLASGNDVCGNCLRCECMWVRKSTHFSVLVCCECSVRVL